MDSQSWWLRVTVFLRLHRWTDWAILGGLVLLYGITTRLLTLPVLLAKWASAWQRTWWVVTLGLLLGALEDLCVCAALCGALWSFDRITLKSPAQRHEAERLRRQRQAAKASTADDAEAGTRRFGRDDGRTHTLSEAAELGAQLGRLMVYALVFLAAVGGLCADSIFLRTRQMRFSADFVAMLVREWDAAGEFEVADEEWGLLCWTIAPTLLLALFVGLLGATWVNLTDWDVLRFVHRCCLNRQCLAPATSSSGGYERVHGTSSASDDVQIDAEAQTSSRRRPEPPRLRLAPGKLLALLLLTLFLAIFTLAKLLPSIVGLIALNPALSEPLRLLTGTQLVAALRFSRSKPMSDFVEHDTERAELFHEDSLYRRTLGFEGPLAFDANVGEEERPNVLVLVVESFRMQDSRFLLDATLEDKLEAATAALLPENVTLTPNFDFWAAHGVALPNLWAPWRTSRSLETLLFGQLPYDSATETGTTSGREEMKLSGLPQLFKAKGYDTLFTAGTRADYDGWDVFLPSHGFDSVLDAWGLVGIAEQEMKTDWARGNHVLTYWGIHDDLSYNVLSYLLRNRQFAQNLAQQKKEQARQKAKLEAQAAANNVSLPVNATAESEQPGASTNESAKPWFAVHYTISSHVPFHERPDWYFRYVNEHRAELDAFKPLYEGHEHEELLRDYVQMRYFSDMVFGGFMEQLERDGVLHNSIVAIVGDHGQAPERGSATPEQDQVATSRVAGAIVARGRLRKSVVLKDAASQSDLLNTIADIVGLPEDGLVQSGIGRSLKRQSPATGERVMYSSNPAMNLAAVQGHTRLQFYARDSDAVQAFHTLRDPHQEHDLMAELSPERVRELLQLANDGRALNDYFKRRWDGNCLLQPTC